MFDPEFDPLRDLEMCKHNTMELAKGLAQASQFIRELSHQHQQLHKMIKELNTRIYHIEIQLATWKKD